MGKKKSVEENKLTEKYAEMLQNLQSHYLSLTVSATKMAEKDWKATGKVLIGSSLDGKHWGELDMGVTGFDVNSDSAIATVMVSINNYINSPEFIIDMGDRIMKSMEGDVTTPKILME